MKLSDYKMPTVTQAYRVTIQGNNGICDFEYKMAFNILPYEPPCRCIICDVIYSMQKLKISPDQLGTSIMAIQVFNNCQGIVLMSWQDFRNAVHECGFQYLLSLLPQASEHADLPRSR